MLRIGIDLSVLETSAPTGVERYARRLAENLPAAMPEARVVWIARQGTEVGDAANGAVKVEVLAIGPLGLYRRHDLGRVARELRLDLLHVPVLAAPTIDGCIVTRTLHDLPSTRRDPAESLRDRLGRRRERRLLRLDLPSVAVSSATLDDYRRVAPDAKAMTAVIHHGVDETAFSNPVRRASAIMTQRGWPQIERFVLVVGTQRPRRRPEVLNHALGIVRRDMPDLWLVWVGRGGETIDHSAQVLMTGYLTDEELAALRAAATVAVVPSRHEGFGLPTLEALAAGVPVVAANDAASREIGREAICYYEGDDAPALARMIRDAISTDDPTHRARRITHARAFSWKRSAELHAAFFGSLVANAATTRA